VETTSSNHSLVATYGDCSSISKKKEKTERCVSWSYVQQSSPREMSVFCLGWHVLFGSASLVPQFLFCFLNECMWYRCRERLR
jgi:hypothetical protein